MRWLLLVLFYLSIPASASAQDCPDGTLEGMNPVGNACQLCRGGELESLPPRTVCSDERRFSCDADGAYRTECVLVDPNDPTSDATMCMTAAPKGPGCPNGLTCDEMLGFCRTLCMDPSQCQPGYDCVDERCVLPEPPDMGMADMSSPGDMGTDMASPGDMSSPDMRTRADMNPLDDVGEVDGSMMTKPRDESTGCCAVVAARTHTEPVFILFALLLWRRRHA